MILRVAGSKPARIVPGQGFRLGLRRHFIGSSRDHLLGSVVTAATMDPKYPMIRGGRGDSGTHPFASRKSVMSVIQVSGITSPVLVAPA